jgi:hypothetical protein
MAANCKCNCAHSKHPRRSNRGRRIWPEIGRTGILVCRGILVPPRPSKSLGGRICDCPARTAPPSIPFLDRPGCAPHDVPIVHPGCAEACRTWVWPGWTSSADEGVGTFAVCRWMPARHIRRNGPDLEEWPMFARLMAKWGRGRSAKAKASAPHSWPALPARVSLHSAASMPPFPPGNGRDEGHVAKHSGHIPAAYRFREPACQPLEGRVLLANTIYVDASSPGPTRDGTSWGHAYADLQLALGAAVSGDMWRREHTSRRPTRI